MKSYRHTTGWRGVASALLAAVLFGVSTPLAKAVSPRVDPVLMAGLLYLGSGLGLGAFAWLHGKRSVRRTARAFTSARGTASHAFALPGHPPPARALDLAHGGGQCAPLR